MPPHITFGFAWFLLCYLVSAALIFRAERTLDSSAKEKLADLRRPLRPLPFLFAGGVFGLIAFFPPYVWFFLVAVGLPVLGLLNWRLRTGDLPNSYLSPYLLASVTFGVGLAGLAAALGYSSRYAL